MQDYWRRYADENEGDDVRITELHPVVRLALWREAERRGVSVFELLEVLR